MDACTMSTQKRRQGELAYSNDENSTPTGRTKRLRYNNINGCDLTLKMSPMSMISKGLESTTLCSPFARPILGESKLCNSNRNMLNKLNSHGSESNASDDLMLCDTDDDIVGGEDETSNSATNKLLPKDMDFLLTGDLKIPMNESPNTTTSPDDGLQLGRRSARRCLGLTAAAAESSTPLSKKLPRSPTVQQMNPTVNSNKQPLRQTVSMNDAQIMAALDSLALSGNEGDLIGDLTKPHALPTISNARMGDIKSINSDTLAQLLNGAYDNAVKSYKIIDCRYPYEYDGGHIRGAENVYTQEQLFEVLPLLQNNNNVGTGGSSTSPQRHIIIFHCEFSSERAPRMLRFLRNSDRDNNSAIYPYLNYPEVYLLHNGYKEFFSMHSELCMPCGYRAMLSPEYQEQCRQFRAQMRNCNGGSTVQRNKSRARFPMSQANGHMQVG